MEDIEDIQEESWGIHDPVYDTWMGDDEGPFRFPTETEATKGARILNASMCEPTRFQVKRLAGTFRKTEGKLTLAFYENEEQFLFGKKG